MIDFKVLKGMKTWKVVAVLLTLVILTFINTLPALIDKGMFKAPVVRSPYMPLDDVGITIMQKYHSYNDLVSQHLRQVLDSSTPIEDEFLYNHIEVAFSEGWARGYGEINRLSLCYDGAVTFLKETLETDELHRDAYRILSNSSQTTRMRLNSLEIFLKSYQLRAVEKLMVKIQETEQCKNS